MSLRACLIALASLALACTAHHASATAPVAETTPRGEPRYVVGLLPLRPTTPEAAEEARAQQARILAALTGLIREAPMSVVHPTVASPATLEEARARTEVAKVNALVWGDVSLEGGKLTVKLSSFESTVGAPSGFWPMEYTLADPKGREQLELDALRVGQALMQESLLPMMMRYQPGNVRAMLEALVLKDPRDWVGLVHYLCSPGAARVTELKAFIASHAAGDWPLPVARYLVGELDEQALWAATKDANSHTERIRRIQAHYYLGEAALSGRLPGDEGRAETREARRHFEAAIGTHAFHHPTYDLADFQLEQLRRSLVAGTHREPPPNGEASYPNG